VHHETILKGLSALDFSKIKSRGEADDVLKQYVSDFGTRQFLLKNLYWETKETLALRMNLEALKTNVNEVGEALPIHSKFLKDTLFLRGDKSEYIAIQDEALIKTHFPKAEIVTISNAGHWLHAENPTDFYNEVATFLKN
jgi:pimeloyl-ACP methyl ester carboxylesterase